MPAFSSAQHATDVIASFLRQEAKTDDKIFAGSGMIVAYNIVDVNLRIVLDGRRKPEPGHAYDVFVNDPSAPDAKTDFTMDAETFDKLYRGESQAMMLMMTGKVKAKGDITAAMRLLPAMIRTIPHYKAYRAAH
jgi:hypothetical protein